MAISVIQHRQQVPVVFCAGCVFIIINSLLCLAGRTFAGQFDRFTVTRVDGVYEVHIVALLDAPAMYVYGVITDYKHIYRINPSIVESEILPAKDNKSIRVRNRFEHCFMTFCLATEMVEDIVVAGDGLLLATTVPELSNFTSGSALWQIQSFVEGKTRIQYRATQKPDFFIPPLIGTSIMKSNLRKELTTSFSRIECLAKVMAMREIKNMPVLIADLAEADNDCEGKVSKTEPG